MEFWKLYNNLQNRLLASDLETNRFAQWHTESRGLFPLVLRYCWSLGHYTWCQESSLSEFWSTSYHECPVTSPPRHLMESQGSTESWTQPHVRLYFQTWCVSCPLDFLRENPHASSGFPWFLSWLLWHTCPLMSVGVPWEVAHLPSVSVVSVDTKISRMCPSVSDFRTAHLISKNEYFLTNKIAITHMFRGMRQKNRKSTTSIKLRNIYKKK